MWEWWCGMSAVVCMVWLFRQGDVPGMARWEDGGGHRGGQHKGTLTRMQTYESISLSLEYMEILPDPEPTRGRGYPQNTVTSHQAGTTRILGATLGTWSTCQILFGNPPFFATHGDAVLGLSTLHTPPTQKSTQLSTSLGLVFFPVFPFLMSLPAAGVGSRMQVIANHDEPLRRLLPPVEIISGRYYFTHESR